MATYNKINDWVDYLTEDVDAASDQFVVALSNTAPGSESSNPAADGNGVLANVTQVAYTNLSSRNLTTAASGQSSGTFALDFNDLTLTSTGGTTGPFRYVYIYDDTVANDPLVAYFDYGSSITLQADESIDITFHANGLFTVA